MTNPFHDDGELPDDIAAQFTRASYNEKPKRKVKGVAYTPTAWLFTTVAVVSLLIGSCVLIYSFQSIFNPNTPVVYVTQMTMITATPDDSLYHLPLCSEQPVPQNGFMVIASTMNNITGELLRADLQGEHLCRLTRNGENEADPAISADGQWIYYGAIANDPDRTHAIMRIKPDGMMPPEIQGYGSEPVLSPDGTTLILTMTGLGSYLYGRQAANSDSDDFPLTPRNRYNSHHQNAAWSPDGSQIVYVTDEYDAAATSAKLNLHIMNRDGTDARRVFVSDGLHTNPDWSPDGEHIVFLMMLPDTAIAQLYTIRPDGSELRQLTINSAMKFSPVWSVDSRFIYYVEAKQVYRIHADGTHRVQITDDIAAESLDVWQPQDE